MALFGLIGHRIAARHQSAALLAVGVWLLTLVLAYAQERAGQRGPAEVLLRRMAYPRSSSRAAPAG